MKLIRVERVQELTTFGKSTVWEMSADKNGTFPKPEKLTARVTVWKEHEVIEWIENQFKKNSTHTTNLKLNKKNKLYEDNNKKPLKKKIDDV